MRARFAAFALKEIDFLWRTLDADHPDRQRDEAQVKRELRTAANTFNYVRLQILSADERPPGEVSKVTFRAELYEKGKDRSFTETSLFRHDGEGWRYLSGEVVR